MMKKRLKEIKSISILKKINSNIKKQKNFLNFEAHIEKMKKRQNVKLLH